MKKIIIILLLFVPCIAFSQLYKPTVSYTLFAAGSDTVAEHDSQDTVAVRIGGSTGWGPYINLAQEVNSSVYITAAEKSAETPNMYNLASESWWTFAEKLQVRITSPSVVVTSVVIRTAGLEGACTLVIVPDTVTTNTYTDYGTSKFIGF
jgi:hypothetical protein